MTIPGTPEGIEVVRMGIAGPDDFEIVGNSIQKGKREGTISQVIVRPAKGWEFRFDARRYGLWPVKMLDAPAEVTYELKFKFTALDDQEHVETAFLKMLESWKISGFEGFQKK